MNKSLKNKLIDYLLENEQQLRTIGEIEGSGITDELVEKTMKEVKDGERCKNCLAVIDEESYNKEYEDRGECHGVPCQELICTGYTCKYCGTEDTL